MNARVTVCSYRAVNQSFRLLQAVFFYVFLGDGLRVRAVTDHVHDVLGEVQNETFFLLAVSAGNDLLGRSLNRDDHVLTVQTVRTEIFARQRFFPMMQQKRKRLLQTISHSLAPLRSIWRRLMS